MDRDVRQLIMSIKQLSNENRKMVSLRNNFIRGIVFGLGSAIGASVIAAIVLGIIAKFSQAIKNSLY